MPKRKARARPPRLPIGSKVCKPSRPAAAHDERRRPTERSHPSFGAQDRPLGFSVRRRTPHRESSQIQPKHHACSYLTATRDADRRLTRPRLTTTTQVLALAPLALGFAPAAQPRAPTALNGYVPKGLTEAQYKAAVAADKSKAQANKAKYPKGKKTLDIADWLVQMEKKQTLKGDKVVGSGHTFAKQKFSSKSAFDKVFGTNKEMWE